MVRCVKQDAVSSIAKAYQDEYAAAQASTPTSDEHEKLLKRIKHHKQGLDHRCEWAYSLYSRNHFVDDGEKQAPTTSKSIDEIKQELQEAKEMLVLIRFVSWSCWSV